MIKSKSKFLFTGLIFLLLLGYGYQYSPYKIELLGSYDKIWAHRVNSTEKLSSAIKYYKGVELDLLYIEDSNFLDVNHPPAKSIDLSFQNYLNVLNENEKPFLWLDIKNLNKANSNKILKKLLFLLKEKQYPLHKILIETHNPKTLPQFSNAGFKTSYYLPYGLSQMPAENLTKTLGNIKLILKDYPEIAISSDIQDYEILKNNFPNKSKYTWSLGSLLRKNFFQTQKALQDPKVKVVLVTYKSPKGNR